MAEIKDTPESKADQIARVEQMAEGGDTWVLSDNDRLALATVLRDRSGMLAVLKAVDLFVEDGEPCPLCSHSGHNPGCALAAVIARAEGRS